jgi:hypothetical protein
MKDVSDNVKHQRKQHSQAKFPSTFLADVSKSGDRDYLAIFRFRPRLLKIANTSSQ